MPLGQPDNQTSRNNANVAERVTEDMQKQSVHVHRAVDMSVIVRMTLRRVAVILGSPAEKRRSFGRVCDSLPARLVLGLMTIVVMIVDDRP